MYEGSYVFSSPALLHQDLSRFLIEKGHRLIPTSNYSCTLLDGGLLAFHYFQHVGRHLKDLLSLHLNVCFLWDVLHKQGSLPQSFSQ